jgi:DNA-binding transcriptional LysR family regulator
MAVRQDQTSGDLKLGAISTAITGLLPAAMHELSKSTPDIDLFILPGTSSDLYRQVIDESIDAAIIVRPPFAIPKALDWIPLRREPLVLICPERWKALHLRQLLKDKPFIRYDRNNWGGRLADRWMKDHGIVVREGLELDQLEAIAVMVGSGLGVSIVPDWAPPWPEGVNLVRLPLSGTDAPMREIGFLVLRSAPTRRLSSCLLTALHP